MRHNKYTIYIRIYIYIYVLWTIRKKSKKEKYGDGIVFIKFSQHSRQPFIIFLIPSCVRIYSIYVICIQYLLCHCTQCLFFFITITMGIIKWNFDKIKKHAFLIFKENFCL